ncbi:MAG: response regulator transcription factor [Oscillospiraceae bacterium]|nr:response regulator transcription factor [Oscillospiraceae bacterium]
MDDAEKTDSENRTKPVILVVEDDKELAQLIMRSLKRNGYEANVAHTAEEARELAKKKPPDLFVLDVILPDGDGFSLCGEFRQFTDNPVLFLTGRSETRDKITGLNAGGDYYLTKPYDRDEFLTVVKTLLRREEQLKKRIDEASLIVRENICLKLSEYKAYVNGLDAGLTPKEFSVLKILIQNEDKELSAQNIYERLWGTIMNNDANAIRLHISRLKKKMNLDEGSSEFAILSTYGGGYTFKKK